MATRPLRPLRTFTIVPSIPDSLQGLRRVALNLRWSWDRETIDLFRRLDPALWESSRHNPVLMLGSIRQDRLDEAASDDGFVAQYRRVCERLDGYMSDSSGQTSSVRGAVPADTANGARPWFEIAYAVQDGADAAGGAPQPNVAVAYFSMEFGITECLAIYSGGLGVLSGDHLKSSSDLGIPLVAVGLAYQEGYFQQYLNADGWQGEQYPDNDFYNLPLTLERTPDGSPLKVSVELPGRQLWAQVWRAQVGRVPLYLLDSNVPETTVEDRVASLRLYSTGDIRIRQELLLGVGGVRALEALGYRPTVCHVHAGHSAFLGLERIRLLMEEHGLTFWEAKEAVAAGSVFTTHTPVPAGIDRFTPEDMDRYFGDWYGRLGISRDEFLALGRENPHDVQESFSMAVLAITLSGQTNGVSKLHGDVSRKLWPGLWPDVPEHEVPIGSVTNGVHALTWVAGDVATLYDRYLGPRWTEEGMTRADLDRQVWARVDEIPSEELWRTHERRRERLVSFARRRLVQQLRQRGASAAEIERASEVLNPEALTIGFARRFATYKRATLLHQDMERLVAVLKNRDRPIQIIYSGKAHPADNGGKELIREIVRFARREDLRRHIVFIENYDLDVARYLVSGCDVWLNLPRRPHEASGTSGMKAVMNGALHMSVLDGWWAEAYRPGLGWAVGSGEEYQDEGYQDYVEARAVFELLEKEVAPLFYDRGPDGLPRGWIQMMKNSIRDLTDEFNTNRMLREYTQQYYLPAAARYGTLTADGARAARELAGWKRRLEAAWSGVRIEDVDAAPADVAVGMTLPVRAHVQLGSLSPDDVSVQLYDGAVDTDGQIARGQSVEMAVDTNGIDGHQERNGSYTYAGEIPCLASGLHGYSVRIVPAHPDLSSQFEPGLVTWAG
ncbi:MAG TPA: alpha-glucan family phosphorylase [Chloroflexota bacterium]|nr:alpha-glucan family phosphorylase [Chloroflexota bacterium]